MKHEAKKFGPGVTEYVQDRTWGISEGPKLFRVMGNKKLDADKHKVTRIEGKKREVFKSQRVLT